MQDSEKAKLCVDVHYTEDNALVGGVFFENWDDSKPLKEFSLLSDIQASYQPGQFYKRELPCILKFINSSPIFPELVIIDGHVWLENGKPGLGCRLYDALGKKVPVIGVAKNRFRNCELVWPVNRGRSKRPLFVSEVGMIGFRSVDKIASMHGDFRMPTLIKRCDQISKKNIFAMPLNKNNSSQFEDG